MKKVKSLYPGCDQVEQIKNSNFKGRCYDGGPDLIETYSISGKCYCPNYDKFKGWTVENVLSWCNVD